MAFIGLSGSKTKRRSSLVRAPSDRSAEFETGKDVNEKHGYASRQCVHLHRLKLVGGEVAYEEGLSVRTQRHVSRELA
jgi:hypothetical protein